MAAIRSRKFLLYRHLYHSCSFDRRLRQFHPPRLLAISLLRSAHHSMTSSPTSSSSESPSSPNSSPLSKFDPFAVHPFTNCSASQSDGSPHDRQFPTYGYPYGPSLGNYNTRQNQIPQQRIPLATNTPPKTSTKSSVDVHPHPPRPAIFIPFRKDTSSPELADILKADKSPSKSSTTNSDLRTLSNTLYPMAGTNTPPTSSSYMRKY